MASGGLAGAKLAFTRAIELGPNQKPTLTGMEAEFATSPVDKTAQVWIYGDAIMPIAYAKMTIQRDTIKARRNVPAPQTHDEFRSSRKK